MIDEKQIQELIKKYQGELKDVNDNVNGNLEEKYFTSVGVEKICYELFISDLTNLLKQNQ